MSTNVRAGSDFDRLVTTWLADGPTELSDRVMAEALRDVHLTAQRRRWAPWRSLAMAFHPTHAFERVATVFVVGALAVGGALFALNSAPTSPGTQIIPTATSTAPVLAESPRTALPDGWVNVSYSGRITDERGNGVRAQITARLDPVVNEKTVWSDADGRWTMTFLGRSNTSYCLDATVPMAAGTWHQNLTPLGCVRSGWVSNWTVPASTIVSGTVVDKAGNAVKLGPGDSIRVSCGSVATASVSADGSFSISVPRGPVSLTFLPIMNSRGLLYGQSVDVDATSPVNGLIVTIHDDLEG